MASKKEESAGSTGSVARDGKGRYGKKT